MSTRLIMILWDRDSIERRRFRKLFEDGVKQTEAFHWISRCVKFDSESISVMPVACGSGPGYWHRKAVLQTFSIQAGSFKLIYQVNFAVSVKPQMDLRVYQPNWIQEVFLSSCGVHLCNIWIGSPLFQWWTNKKTNKCSVIWQQRAKLILNQTHSVAQWHWKGQSQIQGSWKKKGFPGDGELNRHGTQIKEAKLKEQVCVRQPEKVGRREQPKLCEHQPKLCLKGPRHLF